MERELEEVFWACSFIFLRVPKQQKGMGRKRILQKNLKSKD
jgi:hypothetical protein